MERERREKYAILISIKPKWCKAIASGKKTIELRKTIPKDKSPFKCYIYCSLDGYSFLKDRRTTHPYYTTPTGHVCNGKVIGEFFCDYIVEHCETADADIMERQSRVIREKMLQYANGNSLYGWHISDLKIYDKPKELSEFTKPLDCHRGTQKDNCVGCWDCEVKRPPQSWCYVQRLDV